MSSDPQMGVASTLEAYPEHVHAIGMISIETSNLDMELGALLGSLLHVSRKLGQTIYLTPRTAAGRLKVLENVANAVLKPDSEGLERVLDLIKRGFTLVMRRHEMIHDAWGVGELSEDAPTTVQRVTLPKGSAKPVPVTELTDMIDRFRILIFDIRKEISVVIASWPKAWPDTPRGPAPGEFPLELLPRRKSPQPGILRRLLEGLW